MAPTWRRPEHIIGPRSMAKLAREGFVVIQMDPTHAAVGELMLWTGCTDPNRAWEGLICAIRVMGDHSRMIPFRLTMLDKLGRGEMAFPAAEEVERLLQEMIHAPPIV